MAMDLDELLTPKKAPAGFPRNLEPMSVEQLQVYKQELAEENTRIDAEIVRKKKQREIADSLFKK